MNPRLVKVDRAIYRGERFLAGWISLAMAAIVFLDVVHRIFSRTPGRLSIFFGSAFGADPVALDALFSPILIFICFWSLAFGAVRTRDSSVKRARRSTGAALSLSFAFTAASAIAVQAFLRFVPEGLVWSPYLGLSALLWIGLLGASMAAHLGQHLSLEIGEKIWPARFLPAVRGLKGFLVGAFCLLLAVLACESLADHYRDWRSGPGAGLIPSIDWPKWVVFLVIPYAFGMMSLRFWGQAARVLEQPRSSEVPGLAVSEAPGDAGREAR